VELLSAAEEKAHVSLPNFQMACDKKGEFLRVYAFLKSINDHKVAMEIYDLLLSFWNDKNLYEVEENGSEFSGYYKRDFFDF